MHFFVRAFQFFIGCLKLLVGGLQIGILRAQLPLERRKTLMPPIVDYSLISWHQAPARQRRRDHFLENHQVPEDIGPLGGGWNHRAKSHVHRVVVAVGFDAQSHGLHHLTGPSDGFQGGGQLVAQSLAGHVEDIADACFARRRFQKHPAAAVNIENVAVAIDENANCGTLLEKRLLGEVAQRATIRSGCLGTGPRVRTLQRRHGRQKACQRDAGTAGEIRLSLIDLGLSV